MYNTIVEIYDPTPAKNLRMVRNIFTSLSAAILFCESHIFNEMDDEKKWEMLRPVQVKEGYFKMRCADVIFIISQLPFDVNHDDIVNYFKFEEVGDCRKYKDRKQNVPQMTVTMQNNSVQTVIFQPTIINDSHDPRDVFTDEFLIGIGYLNPDGTVADAPKKA